MPRTLVVSHDPVTRSELERALTRRGHGVTACQSVVQAEAACLVSSFDIALVDRGLSDDGGLIVVRRIRECSWGRRCLVVVATVLSYSSNLKIAISAGADDFLALPLDPATLDVRLLIAETRLAQLQRRLRAESAADRAMVRLRTIDGIHRRILESTSPEEVAGQTLEALHLLVPFDDAGVQRFDFAIDEAVQLAQFVDGEMAVGSAPTGIDAWGVNFQMLQAQPSWKSSLNQTRSRNSFEEQLLARGMESYYHLPLVGRGELVGSLYVAARRIEAFDTESHQVLAEVGTSLATSLVDARLNAEIRRLAVVDELTGLANRRQLVEIGRRELQRAKRYGRPLSVLMVDVDHFKRVNDRYGHPVGDVVLKVLAERCCGSVRDVDLVTRYGGEEFVVLLPECDRAEVHVAAERLRRAVGEKSIESPVGAVEVTVSIGATVSTAATVSLDELIESADEALYQAKEAGRNRVVVAPPRDQATA
jgi:diguanylate cyclase (GGDEF)-like protein